MALWKPPKKPITTNIDIYTTLSNIWDVAFGKNIYAFEVINYFRKKFSVLDAWKGPRYSSGRGMKIGRKNQSLPFVRHCGIQSCFIKFNYQTQPACILVSSKSWEFSCHFFISWETESSRIIFLIPILVLLAKFSTQVLMSYVLSSELKYFVF